MLSYCRCLAFNVSSSFCVEIKCCFCFFRSRALPLIGSVRIDQNSTVRIVVSASTDVALLLLAWRSQGKRRVAVITAKRGSLTFQNRAKMRSVSSS